LTRREVVEQYEDGTEGVPITGITSDRNAIELAQGLADLHQGRHEAVRLGYVLPEEHRPAFAVLARGLQEYPHVRAWYPATLDKFQALRLRLPPAPEVHDYRTARGRKAREGHERHPWDVPRVKQLAARFGWPTP
jgi:hypothetical protein